MLEGITMNFKYVLLFSICTLFLCFTETSFALDPNNFDPGDADIYLNFEGIDSGYNSVPWENKGITVPGERPWSVLEFHRGPAETTPLITVTGSGGGIVGQAADTSHFTPSQPGNVHWWGAKSSTTTPLENAVLGTKAMTVAFWYYNTNSDNNNFVFYSPQIQVLDKDHWAQFQIGNTGFDSSDAFAFDAQNRWIFCAITVDTTTTTDNVKIYYGSETEALVERMVLSKSIAGIFDTDWWFGLGFGFPTGSVENPFVGFIDEVRIYFSTDDSSAALSMANVEKIFQLSVINNCDKVIANDFALEMDLNGDCYVNTADFAMMAMQWIQCNDPEKSDCIQNW